MKFIVDAQLPKSLAIFLIQKGHNAIHTLDLPAKNQISDDEILKIAHNQSRIIITKDSDFIETFLLRDQPQNLVLIRTGNIDNSQLIKLFDANILHFEELIKKHRVIEIWKSKIIVRY